MSKQLVIYVHVVDEDDHSVYSTILTVDADLMHPADDPAITLRGVQTAIDYVLREEAKR